MTNTNAFWHNEAPQTEIANFSKNPYKPAVLTNKLTIYA
jgi:hypothetical protein